ncbi:MAG: YvcK family protein [Acidobacteriales bacterium]|nr:YvcK family protein [Terriglobales bacterium]
MRVVAIGGGTGLATLLRGLKTYVVAPGVARIASTSFAIGSLTAVVTVTDDGGSSGRLRKEFNMPPPGDIRNCMVALSEDEGLLSRLFQYRFPAGEGLGGHNFGNLFVAALSGVVGDFAEAVRESSLILASRGQIFPSTTANVNLEATMDDGSRVLGETKITASQRRIVDLKLVPCDAKPMKETMQALAEADLITMGPGSLYTSLVPNVLVEGIPGAIRASKAKKIYVCNLMQQANESLGLKASEHLLAIRKHAGGKIFDHVIANDAPVSEAMRVKYREQGCDQVACDKAAIEALGLECITGNFIEEVDVVRHNTAAVAAEIMRLGYRQ